jgi:hypothetical protein
MLWALQQAIYARLTGDAALMGRITGVFDHPPAKQAFPYIVLGTTTAEDEDDDRTTGFQAETMIHVWARGHAGGRDVKVIQADVYRLLHRSPPTVTGALVSDATIEFTEQFRDPDGLTTQGVQRLRVTMQAAPPAPPEDED